MYKTVYYYWVRRTDSSSSLTLLGSGVVGSRMVPETTDDPYVACPAPACNRKGRRSVIREHLAEREDQRHERFDGSEI